MRQLLIILVSICCLSFNQKEPKTYKSFSKALKSNGPIESIKCLNFDEYEISVFKENFEKFKHLKTLIILGDYKNFKTSFPYEIFELTELETLSIDAIKIVDFKNIIKLENLKYLNIARADLTQIPIEIFKLKKLTYLGFDINNIESIPHEINTLENIEELSFRNNRFDEIPLSIFYLKKLNTIDLGNQEGGGSKFIYGKPISYNNINTFPLFLNEMNSLKQVILAWSCSPEFKTKLKETYPNIKF